MKLENIFGQAMQNRIALYVPGTSGAVNSDPGLAARMVEEVAARLSELFGGATISLAAGAWVSEQYGLIREDVQIVYSYCTDEQLEQNAQEVRRMADEVKRVMEQEAVSVEINNALYLI
jgi:hypothetical protein